MADTTDLFARRNRLRIAAIVVLATLNYMLAVALAAVAVVLGLLLLAIFDFDVLFEIIGSGLGTLKIIGIVLGGIIVISFVVGLVVAIFKIPFARRRLERQVLRETGATIAKGEEHREVRNILEALAIPADIDVPRFAVITDPAPNSFGVGTRPSKSIIGVTTGLSDGAVARRARGRAGLRGEPHPELGRRAVELDRGAHERRDLRGRRR